MRGAVERRRPPRDRALATRARGELHAAELELRLSSETRASRRRPAQHATNARPGYPDTPERIEAAVDALRALGDDALEWATPELDRARAERALLRAHTPEYLERVRAHRGTHDQRRYSTAQWDNFY